MKRLVLTILIIAVASMLFSQVLTPVPKVVYAYGDSDPLNARAFYSEPAAGACNRRVWTFDITVEAQMAQWISWSIGGTKWTWFVRKPGRYFADCIEFSVKSNSDVRFTFSGFSDLTYASTGTSVNPTIPVWYNFGGIVTDVMPPNNPNPWIPAAQLNEEVGELEDSQRLHDGWVTKLWNMIEVVECNSASTYRATGKVTITLMNQKPWIVPETGAYVEGLVEYVTATR